MRLTVENLGAVDGQSVVEELQKWQDELSDYIDDRITYSVLDTVIDIIINNARGDLIAGQAD